MLLALARQIPGVIVAGEPTRGSMAAGEIALFRLPRSGVTISLGTRAFRDPLGGFAETRGFLPDVPIAGRDPGPWTGPRRWQESTIPSAARALCRGATRVSSRR